MGIASNATAQPEYLLMASNGLMMRLSDSTSAPFSVAGELFFTRIRWPPSSSFSPNVANVGGLQIQGVKGDVVVLYFESFTTQKLKSSGVPEG